ncbi:PspC domain-containing protein [Arthrobacter sp. ISL-85]|uniref:PspC domain-containing protein n=1 Tax=Arthrobacter sp. ISL-85 TaxID=2819115 RepID=UPI001BEC7CD9|nr:PspC domain-containing protein [Arthrobacter sp. ISL-85]MBT2567352.1 PspC domain-containing protein [Arthrobacter sp. ISL-85]
MNSQTPSPDDEHPAEPLPDGQPGPGAERPTEPLPSAASTPPDPSTGAPADSSPGYSYQGSPTPAPSTDFFGWIRSNGIYRGNDRWISGVCSGIAHRLGVDPIIIRGVFIVLTLLAGIGVLLYGLAWAFLPEPDGRIHIQEAGAGRWSSGMTGSLIATVLGLTGLGGGFWGWSHNGLSGLLWTLFWVGGAIYLIYYLSQRNKAHPTMAGHGTAAPGGTYPMASPAGHTSTFSAGTASGPAAAPPFGSSSAGATGTGPYGQGSYSPSGSSYPAPWVPPRPPKPRPSGPGAPAVAIATGSALLVGGGLKALDAANIINLGGSANAIVWASAAAVLGLGILVAGFRGRTAGILSLFAVIALVTGGIYNTLGDGRARFQQVDWSPASIEEARGGIDITAGRGTVDLTGLSPTAPLTADVVVPLDITASNVTVVIPQNVPVDVKADMTMGNLNEASGQRGGTTTRESSYNTDRPGNHLVVRIDGTFSNVTIQEGN